MLKRIVVDATCLGQVHARALKNNCSLCRVSDRRTWTTDIEIGRKSEPSHRRSEPMLLRDHPLISCYGIPSWPPNWMLLNGTGPSRLTGEIGILRGVRANELPSTRRCFVYMEYEQSSYLGCLLFYDITFGRHTAALLQSCCNRPIGEIGSLDLTSTL